MSQELNDFFAKVTNDQKLQKKLYVTKEVYDVSVIAKQEGFNVTGAQILRAQANRVLSLSQDDLNLLAAGEKSKSGAQWGRGGHGYLDSAGFWILQIMDWGYSHVSENKHISDFLSQIKDDVKVRERVRVAKHHNDVAFIARDCGFQLSGMDFVRYQATQILKINDIDAETVASGGHPSFANL